MKYTLESGQTVACGCGLLMAGLLTSSPALSVQLEQSVYYRAELTDNVNQVPNTPLDELTNVFGYDVIYRDRTSRTQSLVDANLEGLLHTEGTQDDRLFGSADISFRYTHLPQRLDWVFEDFMRSDRIDTLGRSNADNRQVRNSLRIGPDFTARLTARDELSVNARFINEYEDRTQFDSNRINLISELTHRMSAGSTLSGTYSALLVDYDDDVVNTDFDQHELAATYRGTMPRGNYSLSAGTSYVSRDNGVSNTGALASADVAWQANSRSTYSASFEQNFSDRARDDLGAAAPVAGTARSNVFYDRRLNLGYAYRSTFTEARVQLYVRDQDFEDVTVADEMSVGTVVNFQTEVAPLTDLFLMARYDQYEFTIINRTDDEYAISAAIERQLSRRLSIRGELRRNQRESSDNLQDFEENRIGVRVDYRL